MDDILQHLHQLSEHVGLLEDYVQKLKAERETLQEKLEATKVQLVAERRKYEAAKSVSKLGNGLDSEALRKKIDNYLEEIDICLKIFGNQS